MNFWSDQISLGAKLRGADFVFFDSHSKISFSELESFTEAFSSQLAKVAINSSDRVLLVLPRAVSSASVSAALLANDIPALAIERANIASTYQRTVKALDPGAVIFLEADRKQILSSGEFDHVAEITTPFQNRDQIRLAVRKSQARVDSPAELGWLLATSGSTRDPRLVMIGRQNLVGRAQGEVRDFKLTAKDEIINALSFTHDVGFNQLLSTLASLATLKIQNQPFALALLNWIRLPSSSGVSATPLLWNQVVALSQETFSSFRYVAVSGGSLAPADLERLARMFPGAELIRTYGQTETFRSLLNRTNDFDSQGSPIEGVKLQLTTEGELIHSGVGTALGYFGAPDATTEKYSAAGVRTGDMFEVTSNGHYRFRGRRDDMIKRFEIRMHLSEVEDAIAELNGVETVAVVSKPSAHDDPRENLLAAFVTLVPNSTLSRDDIKKACKTKLEPAKQPDLIEILDEMPQTTSHKIDRAGLKKRWG